MRPSTNSRFSKELRLLASTRTRTATRLDDAWPTQAAEPSCAALAASAASAGDDETLWLWGGEPCLRPDLPKVIAACAQASRRPVGVRTDGLALASTSALAPLCDAGLSSIRITLHSSRPEAHDWLVNLDGAGRRALLALRACVDSGLSVEVEATVTRPTAPHLPELLLLCRRLGVRRFNLRRLTCSGPAAADFIALAPRFALTEPLLHEIGGMLDEHTSLALEGFPRCAVGAAAPFCRPPDTLRWSLEPPGVAHIEGCPACPGLPGCQGAPNDYVEHFGSAEFCSEDGGASSPRPPSAPPSGNEIAPPPPRLGRAPATRHRVVTAQVNLQVGGDPLAPRAPLRERAAIRLDIPADAPSRRVRQQLVRAAQEGATLLRIDAPAVLQHVNGVSLLRECIRLGFERVELHTDLRDLTGYGDADVYALRGFDLALAQLGRPEDYADAKPQLERMARLANAGTGVVAYIGDPTQVVSFAQAWSDGRLPGPPRFQLAPGDGPLEALVTAREHLPAESARALDAALPSCLRASQSLGEPCDTLHPCSCSAEPRTDCPGVPAGWSLPV